MTQDEASSFFKNYADAFDGFDAAAIAGMFDVPSMIVTPKGSVAYTTDNQLVSNFEKLNVLHKSSGYINAELVSCNVEQKLGTSFALVATTWKFHRNKKPFNSEFQMQYLLRKTNSEWKISSTINME